MLEKQANTVFLGIGSNLDSSFGNRFKNIELAISFLEANKRLKDISETIISIVNY